MSINGIKPKVTAEVVVEDFQEKLINVKLIDGNISTGKRIIELYTHDQVVFLLKRFGEEVNYSAGQNGWGWNPIGDGMIKGFLDDI